MVTWSPSFPFPLHLVPFLALPFSLLFNLPLPFSFSTLLLPSLTLEVETPKSSYEGRSYC